MSTVKKFEKQPVIPDPPNTRTDIKSVFLQKADVFNPALKAWADSFNVSVVDNLNALVDVLNQQLPYINTVSDADAAIRAVYTAIAQVNTVSAGIENVNTCATWIDKIKLVAENMAEVVSAQGYAEEARKWALMAEAVANVKPATKEALGLVIVGDGLDVNTNGMISVENNVIKNTISTETPAPGLIPRAGLSATIDSNWLPASLRKSVPVGAIMSWPIDRPEPDGWLRCNGGTFEATEYPELALALNGTILPNSGRTVADVHFIDSGSGSKKWWALAVNPTSGDIWASTYGTGAQSVYVQRGGTGEWTNMGAPNSSYMPQSIAVEKISGDIWACGEKFVSVLRGGTGSWETVKTSSGINYIIKVAYYNSTNKHVIAYSESNVLYWSFDNGSTWKFQINMPFTAKEATWIGAYGNTQLMISYQSSAAFVDSVNPSTAQNNTLFGYGIYNDVNDTLYGYSDDMMIVAHKDQNYRSMLKTTMRFNRSPIINPYNFDLIMPSSSVYGFPFMYFSNNKIQTVYIPYDYLIQFQDCAFCKENEIVLCGSSIESPIYRIKLDLCQEIVKAV